MAKKPVPTPPQKPTAPVTTLETVTDTEDLPRILNVVHIKSGKSMQVSKSHYLLHKEKFTRE